MDYISVQKAIEKGEGKVKLRGWCYRERGSNAVRFIVMRDSTNIIQCVFVKENIPAELWQDAEKIKMESSFEVEGEIVKNDKAPTNYEIKVEKLKIIDFGEDFPNYRWDLAVSDVPSFGEQEALKHLRQIDLTISYVGQEKYAYKLRLFRFVPRTKS